MYSIEKGRLMRDGTPIFAVGQSYYPSFHHAKFPVPPEGDRMGEMKKDLAHMQAIGINHVRFAALGGVQRLATGEYQANTPFVDAMVEECSRVGMSSSVRLQGYSVNLSGQNDVKMIDENGEEQKPLWLDFIETTFSDEQILADNRCFSAVLGKHFAKAPDMVAAQIYNEPHYPGNVVFDYHPKNVQAYRAWLVRRGDMTAEQAQAYEPPRKRHEHPAHMWALWRLFSRDNLTAFLNNASDGVKDAVALPTYTCFTGDQISNRNVYRGCDFFANAKHMDVVGFTCYFRAMAEEYFQFTLLCDMAECAAAAEGKHAWCIELDARTYIPPHLFSKASYAAVGSGIKGIVYYQWRGDYPARETPNPNSCGFVNYDGTPTENYENACATVAFLNRLSPLLARAERVYGGVGMLHSDYAAFLADARENPDGQTMADGIRNSYIADQLELYIRLRRTGHDVTLTDAEHLVSNPLGIRVLFVPRLSLLSKRERAAVDAFVAEGGRVYHNLFADGYAGGWGLVEYPEKTPATLAERVFVPVYTVEDVLDMCALPPLVHTSDACLGTQVLRGEDYTLITVNSLSAARATVGGRLRVALPFTEAILHTHDGRGTLTVENGELVLSDIADGCVIELRG